MARRDLDPIEVEKMALAHQQRVIDALKIRSPDERLERFEYSPPPSRGAVLVELFVQAAIVLAVILAIGLSLSGGTTP